MDTWRISYLRTIPGIRQTPRFGYPCLAQMDYLCKYCGKTVDNYSFHVCAARRTFCYKCRNYGHFARVCQFHKKEQAIQNDAKFRKKKSKSKIKRDAERMQKYFERKKMSVFPCSGIDNSELSDLMQISTQRQNSTQNTLEKLIAQKRNYKNKNASLQKHIDSLEVTIEKLRTVNKTKLTTSDNDPTRVSLEHLYQSVVKENKEYEETISRMQTKIEDLREEIMGWEIGCERLRQQVRELQHERCDNQSYDTRQYNYGFHGPQNSLNNSDTVYPLLTGNRGICSRGKQRGRQKQRNPGNRNQYRL